MQQFIPTVFKRLQTGMNVVYFERRFGAEHEQGHLCFLSMTRSRSTTVVRHVPLQGRSCITSPSEWKDLVYGAHILSMNDNGTQSNLPNGGAPVGRDRTEDRGCW